MLTKIKSYSGRSMSALGLSRSSSGPSAASGSVDFGDFTASLGMAMVTLSYPSLCVSHPRARTTPLRSAPNTLDVPMVL